MTSYFKCRSCGKAVEMWAIVEHCPHCGVSSPMTCSECGKNTCGLSDGDLCYACASKNTKAGGGCGAGVVLLVVLCTLAWFGSRLV